MSNYQTNPKAAAAPSPLLEQREAARAIQANRPNAKSTHRRYDARRGSPGYVSERLPDGTARTLVRLRRQEELQSEDVPS